MPILANRPKISLPLREARLNDLIRHVQGCRACPRMDGRRRVLTRLNGSARARVMFVAEAPGRNGADRTGVPIHGDPTGDNFERFLEHVGWTRDSVFVTNCVLCNPRTADGNNDTPTDEEIQNCSFNLADQIRVVDPAVVVTVGSKPLQAVSLLEPHDLELRKAVGKPVRWFGRWLYPLYHMSPRALLHRKIGMQERDFEELAVFVETKAGGLVRA